MIQYWRKLDKNIHGEISEQGSIFKTVVFEYDHRGNLITELETKSNELTKYFYKDDGRLIKKEVWNAHAGEYLFETRYEYDDARNLRRIVSIVDGREVYPMYFSSGLLDSSVSIGGIKTRYRYVYD